MRRDGLCNLQVPFLSDQGSRIFEESGLATGCSGDGDVRES